MSGRTSTTGDILAVGELLWDVLPKEKLLGGAPANFCFRLQTLGTSPRLVTKVGNDALGDELLSRLGDKGLDLSLVQKDSSYPTGTVDVVLTSDGNPSFTINTGVAYDYLETPADLMEAARSARLVYFGTLVQRSPQTRQSLYAILDAATNALKFLDINLRRNCFTAETVRESLRRTDILKLNSSEVGVVAELLGWGSMNPQELADRVLKEFDLKIVLVTLGENGVAAFSADGKQVTTPGVRVTVADTIGAGDSFAAGFIHKYLSGAGLEECCKFGNAVGAMAATKKGGMPDFTPTEMEGFFANAR